MRSRRQILKDGILGPLSVARLVTDGGQRRLLIAEDEISDGGVGKLHDDRDGLSILGRDGESCVNQEMLKRGQRLREVVVFFGFLGDWGDDLAVDDVGDVRRRRGGSNRQANDTEGVRAAA